MMKIKKTLFLIIGSLFLLTGCSNDNGILPSNTKTYPSIDLPYTIADKEITKYEDVEAVKDNHAYQVLESINIRDLTLEENEIFLERVKNNTVNDLNEKYSAIEFSFGDTNLLGSATLDYFHKDKTHFIYDDKIVTNKIYQKRFWEDITVYQGYSEEYEEEVSFGAKHTDYRIVVLIEKEYLKEGLQLKTVINDEVVYINIK